MADDDRIITPTQLQPTQIDVDKQLLRDEDLLNEEHLRRMDQVLLRRNLDHARMFSRKLSLELQQYVHPLHAGGQRAPPADREVHGHGAHDRARDGPPAHGTSPSVIRSVTGAIVDSPVQRRGHMWITPDLISPLLSRP